MLLSRGGCRAACGLSWSDVVRLLACLACVCALVGTSRGATVAPHDSELKWREENGRRIASLSGLWGFVPAKQLGGIRPMGRNATGSSLPGFSVTR